jgi:hypothetical protein
MPWTGEESNNFVLGTVPIALSLPAHLFLSAHLAVRAEPLERVLLLRFVLASTTYFAIISLKIMTHYLNTITAEKHNLQSACAAPAGHTEPTLPSEHIERD